MNVNKLPIILISLASVALVVSGCLNKPATPSVNLNQNTNNATTTTEIDTSDWKTYQNEQYGFEFKYPPTLSIKESDIYINVLFADSFNINIDVLDNGLDPKTIKSAIGIVTQESLEEVVVGGRLSYRFRDGDAGYGGNSYRIPLDTTHTLLMWFVSDGGYYTNNEREIISVFKFID